MIAFVLMATHIDIMKISQKSKLPADKASYITTRRMETAKHRSINIISSKGSKFSRPYQQQYEDIVVNGCC
eukprot:scaffold251523_cov35-Prasinocladus_malaysianus.AAC.2